MTKMEKFDLLDEAYEKINKELNKAYDAWDAIINTVPFDEKAVEFCKGVANGLVRARSLIADLKLQVLEEEDK